jgi:hypothetical protein
MKKLVVGPGISSMGCVGKQGAGRKMLDGSSLLDCYVCRSYYLAASCIAACLFCITMLFSVLAGISGTHMEHHEYDVAEVLCSSKV